MRGGPMCGAPWRHTPQGRTRGRVPPGVPPVAERTSPAGLPGTVAASEAMPLHPSLDCEFLRDETRKVPVVRFSHFHSVVEGALAFSQSFGLI